MEKIGKGGAGDLNSAQRHPAEGREHRGEVLRLFRTQGFRVPDENHFVEKDGGGLLFVEGQRFVVADDAQAARRSVAVEQAHARTRI